MSIILAITTDGRGEYLERTIDSIEARLTGDIAARLIWDDSGDAGYLDWLGETFTPRGWCVWRSAPHRVGHAQARADLWQFVAGLPYSHVAGWEDDFVLTRPVNLDHLVEVLDLNPHLSQMALLRNACYPRELSVPSRILGWPRARFRQRSTQGRWWFQHRLFWTCNPSVYRVSLCSEGWPVEPGSEKVFHERQVALHRWSAFWGHMDDEPALEHIGLQRAGGWY